MTTCPECNDTGERDSGGTHPWGEPVYLPCDCKDAEIGKRWRDDARGVLVPIEPDPWVRLMKLANEYAMHVTDAAMHEAESRADISRTAALKTMAQMREVFFAHCREVEQGTRHACSIAVWMTLQEALAPDADDKGLDGWMREAEARVKARA